MDEETASKINEDLEKFKEEMVGKYGDLVMAMSVASKEKELAPIFVANGDKLDYTSLVAFITKTLQSEILYRIGMLDQSS